MDCPRLRKEVKIRRCLSRDSSSRMSQVQLKCGKIVVTVKPERATPPPSTLAVNLLRKLQRLIVI